MRRTDSYTDTSAVRIEDCPRNSGRTHRVLYTLVLLFVLTGVSGIACFMSMLMPRQIAQLDENCVSSLRTAAVGDSVRLGRYEQDNDLADGAEAIEWTVLSKQTDRVLLISKYALDCAPYNTDSAMTTWDYSTILHWLNESFYTTAFSPAEQALVQLTRVEPSANIHFDTDPGRTTNSRVFLLSINEANTYFHSSDDRRCVPTAYAVARGAGTESNGGCGWWLRSPGYDGTAASRVLSDGSFSFIGQPAQRSLAVRPAVWVECGEDTQI